jgi:hypothetical protein
VSEQKPFGYSAITEQEERLNDDPACTDPMCSYRAESHRIPELEAENERLQETEEGILHAAYDALKMLEAGSPDTAAAILRGRLKGYPPFQRRVDDNSAR